MVTLRFIFLRPYYCELGIHVVGSLRGPNGSPERRLVMLRNCRLESKFHTEWAKICRESVETDLER